MVNPGRRDMMRRAVQTLGTFALLRLAARARAGASCSDPSSESLRASLNYKDSAANPAQSCAVCTFFTAAPKSPCGSCTIMNDHVNPKGHCDSWTAKG